MIEISKFKLYKNGEEISNDTGVIIEHINNIEFIFYNENNINLNQVSNFDFDLYEEINIETCFLRPTLLNKYNVIKELKITGLAICATNPKEIIDFEVSFYNLKFSNIKGGLNTESTMMITLTESEL